MQRDLISMNPIRVIWTIHRLGRLVVASRFEAWRLG